MAACIMASIIGVQTASSSIHNQQQSMTFHLSHLVTCLWWTGSQVIQL